MSMIYRGAFDFPAQPFALPAPSFTPVGYAERAYFTTDACAHCAAWEDRKRVARLGELARAAARRR